MNQFEPGQILRFTYNTPKEDEATDRYKEVFILNGDYLGKVHGLDMKRLSPADREVLQLLMDPKSKGKVHRIPIVNDILKRMDPLIEVKNPVSFYAKFVRPFLHGKDAYRSYWQHRMTNSTIVAQSHVTGPATSSAVSNPKPLFHNISPQPGKSAAASPKQVRQPLFHPVAPRKGSTIKPRIVRPKKGRTV